MWEFSHLWPETRRVIYIGLNDLRSKAPDKVALIRFMLRPMRCAGGKSLASWVGPRSPDCFNG
jgi:hypothetical protein